MNANQVSPAGKNEYRAAVVLSYLVSIGMLVCLMYAVVQLSHRLFPEWQNNYLLVVTAVVALEGMLTTRKIDDYPTFSPEWFVYRLAEWVVLLIGLKALMYLLRGPAQLLTDVLVWDERFMETFFTPEYATVVLIAAVVWMLALGFGHYLQDLEASVDELKLEAQGMVVKDRTRLRRSLEATIFGLGIAMMIMLAFTHADIQVMGPSPSSLRSSVFILLLYFLLGFILLAQTQFFIQRARWYLQDVPASPHIGLRWALYSLLLIGLIAAIVSLLPTGYSADFFRWLQLAVGVIIGLLTYLFLLIITPFLLLFQWLASLFRPRFPVSLPPITPPLPPPVEPVEPDMLWMVIKSLIFWTIFFSVIFFSFRYYFQQHQDTWEKFKRRRELAWLVRLLEWLGKRWRRLRRRVENAVETGTERLRVETSRRLALPDLTGIARRLPARTQVLLIYREMLHWNAQNGIRRQRNQTPYDYARVLVELLPAARPDVEIITANFMEARYTGHQIRRENAEQVRASWKRLRQRLRLQLNQAGQ